MGLFDHLFKAKSPSGEEKAGEHALEGNAAAKPGEGAPRTPGPQRADPSPFLHPKNFVPRGATGFTPAPRPSSALSGKTSERRAASGGPSPAADEIVLTLGDVLSRIPTHYLKAGAHDAKRELRFKINDLSSDIARGRAAVPLSRIAQLAPEIFVKEISRDEDTEVRLPLQKLVEQIGLLRSQPKTSLAEKIARPITTAELPPVVKTMLSVEARKAEPIVVPSVVEPIIPLAGQPPATPIILAEPATPQKAIELKPAAEHAAAPVILGPPPVIETPVVTLTPVAPLPPEPEPASAVPEAKQTVEPAQPALEPAVAIFTPLPAAPPTVPELHKIDIDWGGDASVPGEAGWKSSTLDLATEPARIEPATEAPRLAPLESPQLDPGEESIQLSLAAILRNCPPEIVVGQLPHVNDSVRITLPFAPIDRQLIKGQVEVSALRFIAALPEVYQKYFVAKVGVKVPIALEEVFQNLPTPTHELTPAPPVPPPVVLAPAAPAMAAALTAAVPAEQIQEPTVPLVPREAPKSDVPPLSVVAPPEPLAPPVPATATEPPPIPSMAASWTRESPQAGQSDPVPPRMPVPSGPEVPSAAEIEPPAVPAVAPPEASAAVPAADVTPPPLPMSYAAESPRAAAGESPQIGFHPPVFRPHFVPPPPIFGFTPPPPIVPEPERASKPEPPSVLTGLTETELPPAASSPESAPLEPDAAAAPSAEAAVAQAETVVAPLPEAPAADAAIVTPAAEAPVPLPGVRAEPPPLPQDASAPEPSKAEAAPEAGSEDAPTADLMALAGEHAAPDLVQFSSEPVPFADLAEMLAHETTYAPDLAEAMHLDIPDAESGESKAPAAAEQPQTQAGEHRAVPIVEGLAATAVAATIAEHVPLHFHDAVPVVEQPKSPEEAVVPVETPEMEKPGTGEPLIPDQPAPAAETTPPLAQSVAEPEKAALVLEIPEAPANEAPAAVVLPPPPLPLAPPAKLQLHIEPAALEVLPPPPLPLRRFDQDAVQALFMTDEALDLPKISRLAAALPGVYACVIATRDQACTGGTLPEGFDLAALLGLAPRVGEAAGRMPIGHLKHFTLYGDAYSVSFFERHGLSLCAVHRPRSFVPGVREKLVALADELSL